MDIKKEIFKNQKKKNPQMFLQVNKWANHEWTINSHNNLGESQMHFAKSKKPHKERLQTAWFHFYDILEQLQRQKRYQWLPQSGAGRHQEVTTKKFERIFFWVIKLLYFDVVGDIFLYAFIKTHITICCKGKLFWCKLYLN